MKYLSIILLVFICGCRQNRISESLFVPHKWDTVDIYENGYNTMDIRGFIKARIRFHVDTIHIHDTIYIRKTTHINSAKSVIIGGDNNQPINQ